jgi:hypothetical protein
MHSLAENSVQPLSRGYTSVPLIVFCLIVAFPVCASGQGRDDQDNLLAKSWGRLKITDASKTAGGRASRETAKTKDTDSGSSLPIEVNNVLDLNLQHILKKAEGIVERFNRFRLKTDLFLGLDASVDERVVHRSGLLVRKMSILIRELRDVNNGARAGPLSIQTAPVRDSGIQLYFVASRLDLLMEEQDRCGLRNLGLLLSAFESLALELDNNPFGVEQLVPDMHYFFFEHHLPNIVPREGGRLVLVGRGLWDDGRPTLAFVDRISGETMGPLEVSRIRADQAVAVTIEPEWIANNAGRCLYLSRSDNSESDVDAQQYPKLLTAAYLPVCIPLSFGTTYKISGFLEYRTPTRTRLHESRAMLFENASCTEEKQVSGTLEWELEPGGWLVDMGESALYEAGTASIDCQISKSRINCEGRLAPAVCGQTPRSGESGQQPGLLLEQAEWEHIFTPAEEYPEEELHRSWALSESVDLERSETQISLEIPREEPSEETTIWYEFIAVNGGQQSTLFISPKRTLNEVGRDSHVIHQHRIDVEYNVAPSATTAKIDMSMESDACRY